MYIFGRAQKASAHLTHQMRDTLSHPSPAYMHENRCLETAKNSALVLWIEALLGFFALTSFYANWFTITLFLLAIIARGQQPHLALPLTTIFASEVPVLLSSIRYSFLNQLEVR